MTDDSSNRSLIKPARLQPGETIRIVSPSWFGGDTFIPRAMRGVRFLESLGFSMEIGTHAFGNAGHVSGSVAERVEDLHAAFADPQVRMVLATIGGTHAADLLPHLDFELVRENPKIFMGFSDNTILHTAFRKECGLATLYGPGLLTDWAEHPSMTESALRTALHLMTSIQPLGEIEAPLWWTDEFLDWETGEDTTRVRQGHENSGPLWIRGGIASGRIIGGCLESLQQLRGTRWWPDFKDAILCLETSEECLDPLSFDAMIGDYIRMGVFDCIAGLMVARPYGFNHSQHMSFSKCLADRVTGYSFPVVANMDFGHTSPMITMPLGIHVTMDSCSNSIRVIESFSTPNFL